ncbi:helix-turn-helix domain-containing protein [Planobispora siamensis]|uniref:Uncharacterized protein n=1 Tax=Planobispora siamensis TaxID=936338 RepID=A0A8J3WKT9_9ACTN|nr:helix-turn-helix domain-containing protein [Planobispora siamensis]GIH91171.1 hypothetical protein Psi01_18010 [Planobispora siamensis]
MPDKVPNARLRAWRNANRLTRLELAEQINATATGVAERLTCDPERVRRWETGDVRWPSTAYRLALTQLTGQRPEDLGFVRSQRDETVKTSEDAAGSTPVHAVQDRQSFSADEDVPAPVSAAELRLATDPHITAGLDWLDQQAGWAPGSSRRKVASHLVGLDPRTLSDRAQVRGRISLGQVAHALASYYGAAVSDEGLLPYRIREQDALITTSIVTHHNWIGLNFLLGAEEGDFTLTEMTSPQVPMDQLCSDAAVACLAESLIAGRRIVNTPLYRMTKVDISPGRLSAGFGITQFVHYALSMDLLERELLDALADGRPIHTGALPLRDRYLPDLKTVAHPSERLCAGGSLALCAIARPASRARRGRPDYVILVQERSGNVLNSAQKLAVIPKAFHEPLVDFGEDVSILATIEREMEEELFGRDDVDSTHGDQLHADPMHASRLSEPMMWLTEHPEHWRVESTGFGFNLVSGNYEFPALIVIEDEEWWGRFGGHIAANWECSGMRRYSTLDAGLIRSLLHDPAWSNEGLFALSEGLRRLAEIGGPRVNLPSIEWEL